jgi:hypothetical protein
MRESDAIRFAKKELADLGLVDWRIEIRPGKLAAHDLCQGATYFSADGKSGVIVLRARDVLGMPDKRVREIILHEVAHAFAGPEENHGDKWRLIARGLGIPDNPHGIDPKLYKAVKTLRPMRKRRG